MENQNITKIIYSKTINITPLLDFISYYHLVYYKRPPNLDYLLKDSVISAEALLYLFSQYIVISDDDIPLQINITPEDQQTYFCKLLERRARLNVFDQALFYRNINLSDNSVDEPVYFTYSNSGYRSELKKYILPRTDLLLPSKVKDHLEKIFQNNNYQIGEYYFDFFLKCYSNDVLSDLKSSKISKKEFKKQKKALVITADNFIQAMLTKYLSFLDFKPGISNSNKYNFISFLQQYLVDPSLSVFTKTLDIKRYYEETQLYFNIGKQINDYVKQVTFYFYIIDLYIRLEPSLESQIRLILNSNKLYHSYFETDIIIKEEEIKYIYMSSITNTKEPISRTVNRFISFLVQMEEVCFSQLQYISLLVYEKKNTKINNDSNN